VKRTWVDPRQTPITGIMSKDVLLLSGDLTLAEATSMLGDYSVSGAPVIGRDGECIGVFSLSDLAGADLGSIERETVSEWMTPLVKWVPLDATAGETARVLVEGGIHRVLVMDGRKIRGIVTALDLARVLARPMRARRAPS
jgi:CBS domain-containing protein